MTATQDAAARSAARAAAPPAPAGGLSPRIVRRLTIPRLRMMRLIADRAGPDGWTREPFYVLQRAAGYSPVGGGRADRGALEAEGWIELRLDHAAQRRGGRAIQQARLTPLGQAVRLQAAALLFGDLLTDRMGVGGRA
jgi:hypothetical protein